MGWRGLFVLAMLAGADPLGAVEIVTDLDPVQRIVADDSATDGFDRDGWPSSDLQSVELVSSSVVDGRSSARADWVNRDDELSIAFELVRAGTSPPGQSTAFIEGVIQFQVDEPMRYELSGEMLVDDSGMGDLAFVEVRLLNITRGRFTIEELYRVDKRSDSTPDEHFRFGLAGGDVTDVEQGSLTGELLPVDPGEMYPDRRYELRYRIAVWDVRDDAGDVGTVANGAVELKLAPFSPPLEPRISATKRDAHAVDDGDGRVEPGETLRYTVLVKNDGTADAEGVILEDVLVDDLDLAVGTVTTSRGTVAVGNLAGDTGVEVHLGTLAPGEVAEVEFDARVDDPLAPDVHMIANRARIVGDDFATVRSDDPDTAVSGDDTITLVANTPLDRCERDRSELEAELEACLEERASLLADADGDGVLDLVDRCPRTTDASTDDLGCSQAQFCAGAGQESGVWRVVACAFADWKNDEPLVAADCRWQGGACVPRAR